MRSICVFSGSRPGARADYATAARALGSELAARGTRLVYGGASVGLMGVVADTVLAAGGEVIGVIPEQLVCKEVAHSGLSDLRVTASMHERKALMAELSDGFVALPGGYGTLEEFAEVLTWSQLGLQRKPCGLLNVAEFYRPLLTFFDHAVSERFVRAEHRDLVLADTDAARLLDTLDAWTPPTLDGWLNRAKPPASVRNQR
ncbi:MAG: TIGR00730 family Rossman fold protein [Pseudonocardiaceae bacterium]